MATKLRITPEKELLIGLIVSDEFIKQIVPIMQVQYLQASSSRTIASWCIEYYEEYKCAPKELIQDIYIQKKKSIKEEDADIIAKVLSHVSSVYESKNKYNVEYTMHNSEIYLRERRITLLQESLEREISSGRVDKAENLLLTYNKVSRVERRETNIWKNKNIVSSIFDKEHNELFRMPGALGELMGYSKRGNLYSYGGVAKRGKTRWLAQTANIAAMQHCNTLLIEIEMTEEEISEIVLNHLVRKPAIDKVSRIPYFGEENEILYKDVVFEARTERDMNRWQTRSDAMCAPFHLLARNPSDATKDRIEEEITALEYHYGFVPDVIVLDYANMMDAKGHDQRDKINNIWLGLKDWAKKYNCALWTASHLNSDALTKDGDAVHVGEDRRILHHVSGMFILNQTEEEKRSGIMRIKATATRFSEYSSLDEVVVLYSYGEGRTYIDSRWKADVPLYNQ